MKRIALVLVLLLLTFMISSCAEFFADSARLKEYKVQEQEELKLAEESHRVEAMPEGPEKDKREKELQARGIEINEKKLDLLGELYGEEFSEEIRAKAEQRVAEIEAEAEQWIAQKKAIQDYFRKYRPLAMKAAKVESEDLVSKYADEIRKLRAVISLATLEDMTPEETEVSFVSYSGSKYMYISVYTTTVFNTLQSDEYQRLAKCFGLVSKDWNETLSNTIGVTEDFEGYIIEIGYLAKNFVEVMSSIKSTDLNIKDLEIASFKISSEDLLKLYDYEITTQRLLDNSLILIDGVRVEPR